MVLLWYDKIESSSLHCSILIKDVQSPICFQREPSKIKDKFGEICWDLKKPVVKITCKAKLTENKYAKKATKSDIGHLNQRVSV